MFVTVAVNAEKLYKNGKANENTILIVNKAWHTMRVSGCILIVSILLCPLFVYGQHEDFRPDTIFYEYRICKLPRPVLFSLLQPAPSQKITRKEVQKRTLLLSVSGEAGYQYFERNGSADNLMLINTTADIATLKLNVLYKERYPLFVFFRYNQSRPFQQDNQYEFNIGFDDKGYKELIREKMARVLKSKFLQEQGTLMANYESLFKQYQQQKQLLQSPAYIQQAVQGRFQQLQAITGASLPGRGEAEMDLPGLPAGNQIPRVATPGNPAGALQSYINRLPGAAELRQRMMDSVTKRITFAEAEANRALERGRDSLQTLLGKYEDSLALQKDKYNKQLDSLNKELADINAPSQLRRYADARGLKDSAVKTPKESLLMKANLRFGKFILNNSELTVNNIFLQGISVKYGDEKFIQVSAGYYDFAFRELFNLRRDTLNRTKQSVLGIKLGVTDGRNLKALNFYIGRKQKAGNLNGQLRTVAGISAERKIYISKHLQFDLELAKSTTRENSPAEKQSPVVKDIFGSFSTRTIGGYASLKAFLPLTKTDASVSYRYWGQQFESFNASQYFNPQSNLAVKITQPFFNRKLTVASGLRYTDFKSYGIASNIKSKTFFASVNATMRIRKLPIISVGYYPGSQLYRMDGNKLYEYFYYIFNTTASHYFKIRTMPMQLVFTHNTFFNKYTDSLVSGAQSYYSVFWTAWAGKFSYQANYSRQELEEAVLSTAEAGISYSSDKLRVGGTAKWNFAGSFTRLGYSGSLGLSLGKTGTVNFIYDRSFLPDRTGVFIPVTTGQVQIIKPIKFRIWQKG